MYDQDPRGIDPEPHQDSELNWPIVDDDRDRTWGRYVVAKPTKRELADAVSRHLVQIREVEQRGIDPVTGREIRNERKLEDWSGRELAGKLFVGQLNYAPCLEEGAVVEMRDGRVIVRGAPVLMCDGRQRTYTVHRATKHVEQVGHPSYDPEERVQVVIWVEANSALRKEIFAALNLGRGGDPASKSKVRWMAPEGPLQRSAKELVERSPHLTQENVNVNLDSVRKNDPRLAGFHSFVKALEQAWGNRSLPDEEAGEEQELVSFLLKFWDRLVEARPEMGPVSLGRRQKSRQQWITGNALFLYGVMRVAVDLFLEEGSQADVSGLDALAGEDGEQFLALTNPEWLQRGIVRQEPDTGRLRITNNMQTRRAMANALHRRFQGGEPVEEAA